MLAAPAKRGSPGGNRSPMSPSAEAPSSGIDQRVADDVRVRMALEPEVVLDRDPAEDERATLDEAVRVEPGSHAVAHPSGSWRGSRARKAVTVR